MYYSDPVFWFWLIFWGIVLTYICWGIAFAFQALLLLNNVEGARQWVKRWYSLKSFRRELIAFYPMIQLFYLLLEVIPHLLFKDRLISFNPHVIWERACEVLED